MRYIIFILICLWGNIANAFPPGFLSAVTSTSAGGGGTTYTDNFNRSNGTLGSNWTRIAVGTWGDGELEIVDNVVYEPTDAQKASSYYSGASFSGDQFASIKYTSGADPSRNGVGVRLNSSGNGYFCELYNATTVGIYKMTSGELTLLGSGITISSIVSNDVIKCTASGTSTTTITAYINNVSVGSRTDSSSPYTSGSPGIISEGQKTLDDFSGGNL